MEGKDKGTDGIKVWCGVPNIGRRRTSRTTKRKVKRRPKRRQKGEL
jgi:hypothetical protein